MDTVKSPFSIQAATYTLGHRLGNTQAILSETSKYIIPVYQRAYSWSEGQVVKLLGDIFTSYWGAVKSAESEPIFIGTMQLSAGGDEKEVIDGQQRLTTFLITIKVLKCLYPNTEALSQISLDWIETKVNDGRQQTLLDAFIQSDTIPEKPTEGDSRYTLNAIIIRNMINDLVSVNIEDTQRFDIEQFLQHLLNDVYFVVIETQAGLSKTLQIFNAINTTGLDLNAGDLFKIRMYEYLKNRGPEDNVNRDPKDNVFGEINKVYALIDEKNKDFNKNITDINGILRIYQYILIAKYELPAELSSYAVDTFFDRFFETEFGITSWDHFKSHRKEIYISLDEISDLIEVRYEWEKKWTEHDYGTAEDVAIVHFWWWSRYGKFWDIIFVFLYRFKEDDDRYQKLFEFSKELVKILLFYSIYYKKSINNIRSTFIRDVVHSLIKEDNGYASIMDVIHTKMGSISPQIEEHSGENPNQFKEIISGNIFDSTKRKNILCRLSALLEEDYKSSDANTINSIIDKIFLTDIDIEHIESRNHKDGSKREEIWKEWGEDLNGIGNLMILRRSRNRSIGNSSFDDKKKAYQDSDIEIVKRIGSEEEIWNLDRCQQRRDTEVQKIMSYLFPQHATS